MPSVEVRIFIVVILVVLVLARRMGVFKWLKERKADKEEARAQQKILEEKQAKRREAKEKLERHKRQTAELLRRSAPGLRQGSVKVGGHDLWYLEGGPPQGSAVLLLHGFASVKEDWAAFANRLVEAGYRIIAPDLPGFGQNVKDADASYDVTSQAKRIRALIKRLDLHSFHVVGSSMGATIAAACAYASGDEVESLTLIEPFGLGIPYRSELDELVVKGRNPMVIASPAAYDNLLEFLYETPPELAPSLKQYRAEQAAKHRVFYLAVWKEVRHGKRAQILDLLLPELKTRTLVLLGEKSRVVHRAAGQVVQTMMPDLAQAVVIDSCGHFPMVERPGDTAQHFLSFLAAAPSPSPPEAGKEG